MKRIICILMILAVLLLSACSGSSTSEENSSVADSPPAEESLADFSSASSAPLPEEVSIPENGQPALSYVKQYYDFTPLNEDECVVDGVNVNNTSFSGILHDDGYIELFEDYTRIYPLNEKHFLAVKRKTEYQVLLNQGTRLRAMSGAIIDRDGEIVFYEPTYRYIPTTQNRLLVFSAESDISGITLKCGIMDGDGNWIREPSVPEEISPILDSSLISVNADGTWEYNNETYFLMWDIDSVIYVFFYTDRPGKYELDDYAFTYDARTDNFCECSMSEIYMPSPLSNNRKIVEKSFSSGQNIRETYNVFNIYDDTNTMVEKLDHHLPIYNADSCNSKDYGDYFLNTEDLSILNISNHESIPVPDSIAEYLTTHITYTGHDFICFLTGHDHLRYFCRIDMNGNLTQEPTQIKDQPCSVEHVVFDDCFATYDESSSVIYMVNLSDGSTRMAIDVSDKITNINRIEYLTKSFFVVSGEGGTSIVNIDGKIIG